MTSPADKPAKKVKEKRLTPAERAEALRYNHMMYGPTAGERRPIAKKVTYGAAYLQHPKFQGLIAAFRKGAPFQFEVTDKGKACPIATDGSNISFNGRVLFYARPSNRYEDLLLLDRSVALQYQTVDALVHLVFAVLRSFPELEPPPLSFQNRAFHLGAETLDVGMADQGPNLLLGSYRHAKAQDQPRKQG